MGTDTVNADTVNTDTVNTDTVKTDTVNTVRITVDEAGFYGLWHKADAETDSRKALIVIGGSEGNENIPMKVGKMFAERGVSTLGMCYFNVPGLPDNLIRVPVDPFGKAVTWLKGQGYEKVFIYGISKGGELALLAASLIPEIGGVVALSPMHCVWSGLEGNKGLLDRKVTNISEFTWRGKDLPCMQTVLKYAPGIWHLITQQQFDLAYMYERPLKQFREETAIEVEKIRGDILFIYPEEDLMWPSGDAVAYMVKRLKDKGFTHDVQVLSYEKASHILVPLSPDALKMFKVERKYPDECRRSREDAFEKTLAWLAAR